MSETKGAVNVLGLCAGIGGLELGIKLACPDARAVALVEREAFPAAILARRMEEGHLDPCPIWSDVATFNAKPLGGCVSILAAGYPCTPFSVAGRQAGEEDPRHVWPHVARVIRECGPQIVFVENVPGHVSRGLPEVLSTLHALGFHGAEWDLFTAAASGAKHIRRRLFLLAYADREYLRDFTERLAWRPPQGVCGQGEEEPVEHGPARYVARQLRGLWSAVKQVARVAPGSPSRVDESRAIGNSVVPEVAARALVTLSRRAVL